MNKTLAWLLLCLGPLLATGAWAEMREPVWLAQLTPEQRRQLHERWEHASPEELAAVRRELRERWPDAPPELREQQRQRLIEQLNRRPPRELDDPREQWRDARPNREDGYGAGYEQRRIEREGFGRPPRGHR